MSYWKIINIAGGFHQIIHQEMCTTRSSITRLLRAAVSHRHRTTSTSVLGPHYNLHRNHHTLTPTSPLSFLHPHPFNHRISQPYFFSTSRRVQPRASESKLRRLCGSLMVKMFKVIFTSFIIGGCIFVWAKFVSIIPESLEKEMGTKFKGSLPDVVEGHMKPVKPGDMDWDIEFYCSATEVLSKPEDIVAAMDRNSYIIAEKLNVAKKKQNVSQEEEKQNVGEEEKLDVAEEKEKQNVVGEEKPDQLVVSRCTTPSDKISNDVAKRSISLSFFKALALEGRVNQSVAKSLIAKLLIVILLEEALDELEGLPDALREGHSVLGQRSVKSIKHGFKEEDKSGKSVAFRVLGSECRISAEVLAKHDKKYMPQDAAAIEE